MCKFARSPQDDTKAEEQEEMAVIVMAENPKLTTDAYDGMLAHLRQTMEQSPGFIAHVGWSTPEGWHVVELWRSQDDANQFFATHVHPVIPPDARPKRRVYEVHALVEPTRGTARP
jgi:heme-degrading monooxygenase HmoA